MRSKILLLCVGTLWATLLSAQDQKGTLSDTDTMQTEYIVRELQHCSNWTDIQARETDLRKDITNVYVSLAKYDTKTIRRGIDFFLQKRPVTNPQSFDDRAKIYAFLRVLFDVPQRFVIADEHFGLMGNPVHDGAVDLMWPFARDDIGHLVLTGTDLGFHTGPPYDALADFDRLAAKFGRRVINMEKGTPKTSSSR